MTMDQHLDMVSTVLKAAKVNHDINKISRAGQTVGAAIVIHVKSNNEAERLCTQFAKYQTREGTGTL